MSYRTKKHTLTFNKIARDFSASNISITQIKNIINFDEINVDDRKFVSLPPFKHRRCSVAISLDDLNVTSVDLQRMVEAGTNIVRFDIVKSTPGGRLKIMKRLDNAVASCCEKYGITDWPIATCVNTKGCMVKTGFLEQEVLEIEILKDSEIILTNDKKELYKCNEHKIFVDNSELVSEYPVGMEISLNKDSIVAVCEKIIDDQSILCKVIVGGKLGHVSSVHGRGMVNTRPYLGHRDMVTIQFALDNNIDIVILSFVRSPQTIRLAKKVMGPKSKRPIIFSGLATQECLENLDEIIKESDGIVLQRDFMSYELDKTNMFKMFKIQRFVSAKCQQAGIPFFLSGDVLKSALTTGKFCDMDVSDITNALFEGATGFILKDCENADQVVKTIKLLNDICISVECYTNTKSNYWRLGYEIKMPVNAAEAAILSCTALANITKAALIILPTVSGRTAKALFWMRPSSIVITVSKKSRVTKFLNIYRCVVPLIYNGTPKKSWYLTVNDRIEYAIEFALKRGYTLYGDTYVTLSRGSEYSCYCDTVRVNKVVMLVKEGDDCNKKNLE